MNHCRWPTFVGSYTASGIRCNDGERSSCLRVSSFGCKFRLCNTKNNKTYWFIDKFNGTYGARIILIVSIFSDSKYYGTLLERVFPLHDLVTRLQVRLLERPLKVFTGQVRSWALALILVRNCIWLLIRNHFDIIILIIIIISVLVLLN